MTYRVTYNLLPGSIQVVDEANRVVASSTTQAGLRMEVQLLVARNELSPLAIIRDEFGHEVKAKEYRN